MKSDLIDVNSLKRQLKKFCDARHWSDRNHVKNLAMAASVEMGEVLDIVQWLTDDEANNMTAEQKDAMSDEIADTINNLVMLADALDINIEASIQQKIIKNALKYPVD